MDLGVIEPFVLEITFQNQNSSTSYFKTAPFEPIAYGGLKIQGFRSIIKMW
jgi:hypothetical protein